MSKGEINSLKRRSLDGNKDAFNELMGYYMTNLMYEQAFYPSLIIANKYANAQAYFMLFWSIAHSDANSNLSLEEMIDRLDGKSRYMCFYYLLKSKELGYAESQEYYKDFFSSKNLNPISAQYLDSLKR